MIKVNGLGELSKWLSGLDKGVARDVTVAVTKDVFENVFELAKPHFSKKSILEQNIREKTLGDTGMVWVADENMLVDWNGKKINYVKFVLYGSKPHKIEAKNKKALKWAGLNGFVKSVNHPGHEGDNFLDAGAKKTFDNLDKIYKGVLNGIK